MKPSRPSPRVRVMAGRNVALTAAAIYALTRMASYASKHPDSLNEAQRIITANGALLGLWAAVWGAAGVLCVVDMVNRHTRYGLSLVVGVAASWGIAYLGLWIFTGFTEHDLLAAAVGWLAPVGMVFGLLLKTAALQAMVRDPGAVKDAGD